MNLSNGIWPWRVWLPSVVVLCGVLLLFRQTATEMVTIWIRSGTFQHAFLVFPISAWLVWRRRQDLRNVRLHAVPWMMAPMAAVAMLWLLGDLAEVAAATQLALVSLIVMSVPALFGWQLTRVVVFPLLFLYFAVPFGEFIVPLLQTWTADVTVFALRATGIPVYREGMLFLIPSGAWSVVEACSGFRYMVALFMVGTLYGYLNYRSTRRRLIFAALTLLISLPANWIRAYSIVMIGHLTGSPMILGVEHTTYGWFLFGIVVFALFWVAARWADEPDAVAPAPAVAVPAETSTAASSWPVVIAILVLLSGTRLLAHQLTQDAGSPVPEIQLSQAEGPWRLVDGSPGLRWPSGVVNPERSARFTFSDGASQVHVWIGYYRHQDDQRKLVTSMHRVAAVEGGAWRSLAAGRRAASNDLPAFSTAIVVPGSSVTMHHTVRDRVWQVYWVSGHWSARPAEVKLRQAWDRLLGRGNDGAVVQLVTTQDDGADARLTAFARSQLGAIDRSLAQVRASR
jgi:exosortase A